jgi:hypothetical protein
MNVGNHAFIEDGGTLFMVYKGKRYMVQPDTVTIKFNDDRGLADKASFYSTFNTTVIRQNKLGIIDITVPPGKSIIEFVQELQASGMLEFAEVNTIGEYIMTPNDTLFNSQWALHNVGQTGGTNDADIDAPEAWDSTTGSPAVVVGVLDSGTDIDHVDLNCNVWVNPGEDIDNDGVVWDLGDINGVDDDSNGKIDDIVGWDFHNNNNNPRGPFYHGTHVAGIVAACSNNGQGIAGVAGGWGASMGSKMMTIGVGDAAPNGSILDDAIIYAADNGAAIITLSLSVGPSSAINSALSYAYNTRGVFIDNASGNDDGPVGYPADDPHVVAVGATRGHRS